MKIDRKVELLNENCNELFDQFISCYGDLTDDPDGLIDSKLKKEAVDSFSALYEAMNKAIININKLKACGL